jgi:hypothetical protein
MERMGQGPRRIKKGRMTFYAVADLEAWMRGSEEQAA